MQKTPLKCQIGYIKKLPKEAKLGVYLSYKYYLKLLIGRIWLYLYIREIFKKNSDFGK